MTTHPYIVLGVLVIAAIMLLIAFAPFVRDHEANRAEGDASNPRTSPHAKHAARADRLPPIAFRAPPLAVIDPQAVIDAIAEVESGNNPLAVGQHGERGRCQFLPATWADLMPGRTTPHRLAADPAFASIAEHRLYERILVTLNKRGMPVTVANIADAWHLGPWHSEAKGASDYAQRVSAIYYDRASEYPTAK